MVPAGFFLKAILGGYLFFKKKLQKLYIARCDGLVWVNFRGNEEKNKGKRFFKPILILLLLLLPPSFLRPFALKMHQGRLVRGKSF